MTADPYAPARRATNGSYGCHVPERIEPRRVFVAEEFAAFNEGTRRARQHGSIAQEAAALAAVTRKQAKGATP